MSSTPITKELFEALRKRGYGAPKADPLKDPIYGVWETMREASKWTGEIFQPQIDTLKRTAMLILGGGPVTITIDQDNLKISFSGPPLTAPNDKVEAVLKTQHTQLEALTLNVLGKGWKVSNEPSTASKSGSAPKPKGTGRAKKGKRKSK